MIIHSVVLSLDKHEDVQVYRDMKPMAVFAHPTLGGHAILFSLVDPDQDLVPRTVDMYLDGQTVPQELSSVYCGSFVGEQAHSDAPVVRHFFIR